MAQESDGTVVMVDILGQRYPIRSTLDPGYIARLAGYVSSKIQAAMDDNRAADVQRVAVLAALNIADELFRARANDDTAESRLALRTAEIERLIDGALADSEP